MAVDEHSITAAARDAANVTNCTPRAGDHGDEAATRTSVADKSAEIIQNEGNIRLFHAQSILACIAGTIMSIETPSEETIADAVRGVCLMIEDGQSLLTEAFSLQRSAQA